MQPGPTAPHHVLTHFQVFLETLAQSSLSLPHAGVFFCRATQHKCGLVPSIGGFLSQITCSYLVALSVSFSRLLQDHDETNASMDQGEPRGALQFAVSACKNGSYLEALWQSSRIHGISIGDPMRAAAAPHQTNSGCSP